MCPTPTDNLSKMETQTWQIRQHCQCCVIFDNFDCAESMKKPITYKMLIYHVHDIWDLLCTKSAGFFRVQAYQEIILQRKK